MNARALFAGLLCLSATTASVACGSSSSSAPAEAGGGPDASAPEAEADGSATVDGGGLPTCSSPFVGHPAVTLSALGGGAPAIAWTGKSYVAVWTEAGPSNTPGPGPSSTLSGSGGALLAIAMDATGTATGIPSRLATNASDAVIARAGTALVVSYEDFYKPTGLGVGIGYLSTVKVNSKGVGLGGAERVDTAEQFGHYFIALASTDTGSLLLNWNIGLKLRAPAAPSSKERLPSEDNHVQAGNIVWNGAQFAVAWRAFGFDGTGAPTLQTVGVHFSEAATNGDLSGPRLQLSSEKTKASQAYAVQKQEVPFVTWTGSDYRIAWFELLPDGVSYSLAATRVANGTADPVTRRAIENGVRPLTAPRWNGAEFDALAVVQGSLALVRYSKDGTQIGAPIVLEAKLPALAEGDVTLLWTGREYVAGRGGASVKVARIGTCGP